MLSSGLAAVALLLVNPVVSLSPKHIFARQNDDNCNQDNCYRQVQGVAAAPSGSVALSDCTSYLVTSVIPCAVTTTEIITISETTTATSEVDVTSTEVDFATSTTVASTTSVETTTTTLLTSTVLTTSLSVVTTTVTPSQAVVKRAATTPKAILARQDDGTCAGPTTVVGSTIPAYASFCDSDISYSSVCECLGVGPSTTTLNTPTVTSTVFTLAEATATETSTNVFTVTTTADNVVLVTSTSVILSTSTVTATEAFTTAATTSFSTTTVTASFDGIFTSLPPFNNGTNSTTATAFPTNTFNGTATAFPTGAFPTSTAVPVSGEFKLSFPDGGRVIVYTTVDQIEDLIIPRYNPFYVDSDGFVRNLGRDVIYLAIGNSASGNDGVYLKQSPRQEQKIVCALTDNRTINGPVRCYVEADENQNTFTICGPNKDLYISTVAQIGAGCEVVQLSAVAEFN